MTGRQKALLAVVSIFVVALAGVVSYSITSKRAAIRADIMAERVMVHSGYGAYAQLTKPTVVSPGAPITLRPALWTESEIRTTTWDKENVSIRFTLTKQDGSAPTYYYATFQYIVSPNIINRTEDFTYTPSSGQTEVKIYADLGMIRCAKTGLEVGDTFNVSLQTLTAGELSNLNSSRGCNYVRWSGAPEKVQFGSSISVGVTPPPPTGTLSLSPASLTLQVDQTADVTVTKSEGTLGGFTVICDLPRVAKLKSGDSWVYNILVSSGNQFTVKGMGEGSTNCRIRERDTGLSITLPVSVAAAGITLDPAPPYTLTVGEQKIIIVSGIQNNSTAGRVECPNDASGEAIVDTGIISLTGGRWQLTLTGLKAGGPIACQLYDDGNGGIRIARFNVTVGAPPLSGVIPIEDFSSPQTEVSQGDSITFTFSGDLQNIIDTTDADFCELQYRKAGEDEGYLILYSGPWTANSITSPPFTGGPGTYEFRLICRKTDGTITHASRTITIAITAGPTPGVDTDGDGIPDTEDPDDDNDGILDEDDGCPLVAGTEANNGCPEGEPWSPPDEPPGPPVVGFEMNLVPDAWNLITLPFTPKSHIQDLTGILGRTPLTWGWYESSYRRAGQAPPATPIRGVGFWIKVADTPANSDDDRVINGIRHRAGTVPRGRYEEASLEDATLERQLPSTSGINIAGNPFRTDLSFSRIEIKIGDGPFKTLKRAFEDREILGVFTWSPTASRYTEITAPNIETAQLKPYQGFWIITGQGTTVTLKYSR